MATARIDIDQLAEYVQWKMDQEDLSLREAAQTAKVSAATLSRLLRKGKKRPRPDTDTLFRLIQWANVPIDKIIETPTAPHTRRNDQQSTPEAIEVHLRADKNLSPNAARAISQMVRVAYEQFSKQRRGHSG